VAPGDDGVWTELELLPLYVLDDVAAAGPEPGPAPPRFPPLPEGFRLLAPPTSARVGPPAGPRPRDLLWVDLARPPSRPSFDRSVHRLIDLPYAPTVAAVLDTHDQLPPQARLAFDLAHARAADGELRLLGWLHVHRCGPPLAVDVVVQPWSRTRTDLWLQARCRRGRAGLPRRYFDVAHAAIDALRDAVDPGARRRRGQRPR
jgi:hypothetical protein